jgi:hypothetical protein
MTFDATLLAEILRHTPPWVWLLLVALLALGASRLRTRRVSRPRLLLLPLALCAIGLLSTASNFTPATAALATWAAAFAGGHWMGRRMPLPAGLRWDAARRELQLPGSVLPLLLIVTLFTLRYAGTVSLVLHPDWRASPAVALPMAAAYGAIAGTLLGRVLGLLRATRPDRTA